VEPVLDGDDVDEEPEVPPIDDEEPLPEVDESEPEPDELLPEPDVPALPRPDDEEDPGRDVDEPGIELEDPGVVELDEPGVLDVSDEDPEPLVPDAPDEPDMPLPEDPDMPLLEAPDDGLLDDVPPMDEPPLEPDDDCAIATPADRDRRTATAVSFFIFHSSICLTTFHLRAWTPKPIENSQTEGGLTRFGSSWHASPTCFMGAS
jgi:hypothetical protein